MNRKPGMAKYAAQIGPWTTDPNYRGWWEREMAGSVEMLATAKAAGDARVTRLAKKRIAQAEAALQVGA